MVQEIRETESEEELGVRGGGQGLERKSTLDLLLGFSSPSATPFLGYSRAVRGQPPRTGRIYLYLGPPPTLSLPFCSKVEWKIRDRIRKGVWRRQRLLSGGREAFFQFPPLHPFLFW